MKKQSLLFLFALLFFTVAKAQTYYFVQVQGTITDLTTGKAIIKGSQVSATSKLKLSPGAKAIVMSSTQGRFNMPDPVKPVQTEIVTFVKDVLSPIKTNAQASTRGDEEKNGIIDFKNYLASGALFVLGNTYTLRVDANLFPMNDDKRFVISYKYNGANVGKKVPYQTDVITLDKKTMFEKDGNAINPEEVAPITLLYYSSLQNKASTEIGKFKIAYFDDQRLLDLKEELSAIADFIPDNDKQSDAGKYYHLFRYVRDVYGKITDETKFKEWLKNNNFLTNTNVSFDNTREANELQSEK
ncbi:MAG: hypothetical protein EAZ55_07345 [Cytophagales bacterium]|nr:MAG: hypothetical protein EAZ55_07345 [Cytophagales bacterium]